MAEPGLDMVVLGPNFFPRPGSMFSVTVALGECWIGCCFLLFSSWRLLVLLRSQGGKIRHSTEQEQCNGLSRDATSKDQRGGKEMLLYWVTALGSACVFPPGLMPYLMETMVDAVF